MSGWLWVVIGAALVIITGLVLALLSRRRKRHRQAIDAACRDLESLTRSLVPPEPTDASGWRLLDDQCNQLTAKLSELVDKPGLSEEQTATLTQMQDVTGRLGTSIDEHRALLVIRPPLTPDQLAPSATVVRARIEDLRETATKRVARPGPHPIVTGPPLGL